MIMIPCLTFDNSAEYKWVMTDKNESVHKPIWTYKKILNLDSGELVKQFIRFNRNVYSIWTSNNNLYEIQSSGTMTKINMDTCIIPTYSHGYYYGVNVENKLSIVKRSEPSICLKQPCKIPEVTNIESLPYTSWLILNTAKGCYRTCIKEQRICTEMPLAASYELFARDTDAAVIALCHHDYKISIIWTSSWKTHHTIRAKPSICLFVNTKHLVYISTERDIYLVDCVSGEDISIIASPWHRPKYIYINDIQNTIISIDEEESVLAFWSIKKTKTKWKPMEISPQLQLLSTVPIDAQITQASFNINQIILNADGYIVKLSNSIESIVFTLPFKIKKWIDNLNSTLTLNEQCTMLLLKTLNSWCKRIVDEPSLCSAYTLRKILKSSSEIRILFQKQINEHIIRLYEQKKFENREYCKLLITLLRSINIDIPTKDLKTPDGVSDFIFWIHTGILNDKCVKKALKKDTQLHFEYLYTIQDKIKQWKNVLESNPFHFLSIKNIKRSFEEGYTNEWINIFKNLKSYNVKNVVAKKVWLALQKHVLCKKTLNDYSFPNVNDGAWKKKENIEQYSWVLVNEVVMNTEHLNVDELELPVLTWVPGPSSVLERAIMLLDKNMWKDIGSKWTKYTDEKLSPGIEIKCSKGTGHVISWPEIILFGGKDVSASEVLDSLYYRNVSFDYTIDPKLRWTATNFLRNILYQKCNIHIKDMYKSCFLELIKPKLTASVLSIDWLGEATSINIDTDNHVWIGEYNGTIKIIDMKRFDGPSVDYIELNNGHTESVNGIEFVDEYAISCSEDGEIRVWDIYDKNCIVYINTGLPVKCIKIISHDTLWYIDSELNTWVWNFDINKKPMSIHSIIPTHRNILISPTNYIMDTCGDYAVTLDKKMTVWFNKYPYDIKSMVLDSTITCVSFITQDELIYGTYNGEIYVLTINDNEKICIWSEKGESCTCILGLEHNEEYTSIVGTQSGKLIFLSLEADETLLASWKANNSIVSLRYKKPLVYILTSDYSIYTIAFDNYPIKRVVKIIENMISDKSWRRYIVMPKNTNTIQSIVISAYRSNTYDLSKVISTCIEDYDNRRAWCTEEMLDVVLEGVKHYPDNYKKIVSKLFCFKGKLFRCSLCLGSSTSPKSNPISMLKTCGHRYHTSCINQHVKKTFEWDDVCMNNWALNVTLKCPECRELFGKKDIMQDRYISDICKYDSGEEEQEL